MQRFREHPNTGACFLYRGKETKPWQQPVYHANLTELFLADVKGFITRNR